ncbi:MULTISPECIES: HpcH/HpaI aldolase/citrate lyase family protein [Cytobacillus]|uniref:HpcH/HpaI aldolase/citrate lyase family protein n=1 Tax=Cytobacillus TaxID=2675230 RepID=UPI002040E5CE|nr:HpcH/HpaI aldolase/citrate lyase family protein [Cytobacillus kochii]MCM3320885.1 HpcH/HpaI aldolase/citrate lyase family protein [Cytobacillus kochii]MCM3344282.1 HpcH/HpaI aldolase/citrate lyase family protein [Cytobacillus kochii]
MRLFTDLSQAALDEYFFKEPTTFNKYTPKNELAYALAATLYMPATRPAIHQDLINKKHAGLTSVVICLEDSIGDLEVEVAERGLQHSLHKLRQDISRGFITLEELPLLFIRIRNKEQLVRLITLFKEEWQLLTGIVIPKFSSIDGEEMLQLVSDLRNSGHELYAMPILETKEVLFKETRMEELKKLKGIFDKYAHFILNIRIGATDFCGLLGIRRNTSTSIYDIAVLRDCLADIMNFFQRAPNHYLLSGPVWEHFVSKEKVNLLSNQTEQIMESSSFMNKLPKEMRGFIAEILLDISNGIIGKTIIHPTQITPVQALNTVTYEEYNDAMDILNHSNGAHGVMKSASQNKMNEMKPHYDWAKKIELKSRVYGVLNEQYNTIDFFQQLSHDRRHRAHAGEAKYQL